MDAKTGNLIRKLVEQQNTLKSTISLLHQELEKLKSTNHDPLKDLNQIPGRRVSYFLTGNQTFTSSQDGTTGADINLDVSQDGPFVWTHFPVVMWRVSSPSNATNFGFWRPVYTWPLPDQVEDSDLIDLSWRIRDAGSQRLLDSETMPPMFSNPGALHPLPMPTLFRPSSVIAFTPTYENILFDSGGTATTGGTLKVMLPGYRIVNQ